MEFLYDKLKAKPSQKSAAICQRVQQYYMEEQQALNQCMLMTMQNLIFSEHNKNIWIYQKCLNYQLVMQMSSNSHDLLPQVQRVVEANVDIGDPARKNKIMQSVTKLINESPLNSLDSKSRDSFGSKFNDFKRFIQDLYSWICGRDLLKCECLQKVEWKYELVCEGEKSAIITQSKEVSI